MRIKSALLATTAVAAVALCPQAQARDFYVSVLGGANIQGDQDNQSFFPSDSSLYSTHLDLDTGYMVALAVGTDLDRWLKGLRVELEMSYRRNHMDVTGFYSDTDTNETSTFVGEGHISTFAVMANVWYDIDIGSKVKPYIGGGAGWARANGNFGGIWHSSGSDTDNDYTNDEQSGFAWQLGVGLNYEVMPDVDVGLGYRYFSGPSLELYDVKVDNDSHVVAASLTVHLR